jgi:hypothetical protein
MVADLGQGLMGLVSSYSRKDMGGVLKSGMGMLRTAGGQSQKIDAWAKNNRSSPADVVRNLFCKDFYFLLLKKALYRYLGVDVKMIKLALILQKQVRLLAQ